MSIRELFKESDLPPPDGIYQIPLDAPLLGTSNIYVNQFFEKFKRIAYENEEISKSSYGKTFKNFLVTIVKGLVEEEPATLMQMSLERMSSFSNLSDLNMNALIQEREEATIERKEALQIFVNARIEVDTFYYKHQMEAAQDHYNDLGFQVNNLVSDLENLQKRLAKGFELIGPLIGYWAYKNQFPPDQMSNPGSINHVLNVLLTDSSYDETSKEDLEKGGVFTRFWKGVGTSSNQAREVLSLMQEVSRASENFEANRASLQDQMVALAQKMDVLKVAWEATVTKINSPEYIQVAIKDFNASPEGTLIQSDIDEITTPLNEITLGVQSRQEVLNSILDSLETKTITDEGMNFDSLSTLTYLQKKQTWFGTEKYLSKSQSRLPEVQKIVATITNRVNQGQHEENDSVHLSLAKQAILNIMSAQLIHRKLEDDIEFQLQLKKDFEEEAKEGLNTSEEVKTSLEVSVPLPTSPSKSHPILLAGAGIALLSLLNRKKSS